MQDVHEKTRSTEEILISVTLCRTQISKGGSEYQANCRLGGVSVTSRDLPKVSVEFELTLIIHRGLRKFDNNY